MPWWLWLIPILAILVFLWFSSRRPVYGRQVRASHLPALVSQFLEQPVIGSVMVLERDQAPGVMQLTLQPGGQGGKRLQIGIPDVDWSNEAFVKVESALRSAGFEVLVEGGGTCAKVRRYLKASTPMETLDLAEAGARLIEIASRQLGWGSKTTYTVHCERMGRNREVSDT